MYIDKVNSIFSKRKIPKNATSGKATNNFPHFTSDKTGNSQSTDN